jgi:predicted acylesterase/phospholipase RssA
MPEPDDGAALVELQRMEAAVVRAAFEHPDVLVRRDVERLRYLLGFTRLRSFQPGAAAKGRRNRRAEVDVGDEVDGLRSRVLEELDGPLRREDDVAKRLRRAQPVLERLWEPLRDTRAAVIAAHSGDFSASELDGEVGRKVLVSVAGGGGGAGFVYIGAYLSLEAAGIRPALVIGSSIGALLGMFRARATRAPWLEYIDLAKQLDRRKLFSPVAARQRYGLPGLLALDLTSSLGASFLREDGLPLHIDDLAIPYRAVVAGVRKRSFEELPERFRRGSRTHTGAAPTARWSVPRLAPAIATRMWQVAAFFDPRVVKPVVLGADALTRQFNAIDAAGFSTAIPGVLNYDIGPADAHMCPLLDELFEREELGALIDGGVVSNVPAELAWREVQAGALGTRNAFYLAFDCFHPQWEPAHLWLVPITQAVQLQMTRNARFADLILRFEPTLSPVNLVPEPSRLDEAIEWGRLALERNLPLVKRFLEPVAWEA